MRHARQVVALLATASIIAVASGCAATTNSAKPSDQAASGSSECVPFPKSQLAPNPKPGTPPAFGDPTTKDALVKMQQAIIDKAKTLSPTGTYCAEGQTDPGVAKCNKGYWGFTYSTEPGAQNNCNFFYSRVDNSYWTQVTPIVLSQYYDYLNLITDGVDIQNQSVGPHTTITQPDKVALMFGKSASRNGPAVPYASLPLTGGKLDVNSVNALVAKTTTDTSGTTPVDKNTKKPVGPNPMFAGAGAAADCFNVWIAPPDGKTVPTTTTPVEDVPVKAGTSFYCAISTAAGQGTAYAEVNMLTPTATSVPVTVVTQQPGGEANLLRKPGGSTSFSPDNVLWPVNIPEVTQAQTAALPVPASCVNAGSNGSSPTDCVHLWLTGIAPDNAGQGGVPFTSCRVFVVLETDKTQVAGTASKYQVPTDGFTAHISLAKNKRAQSASDNDLATCQRTYDLNTSLGLPGNGAPPPGAGSDLN